MSQAGTQRIRRAAALAVVLLSPGLDLHGQAVPMASAPPPEPLAGAPLAVLESGIEASRFEKVSQVILHHRRLKTKPARLSAEEHRKELLLADFDARDLDGERCALYVREPLSAAEVEELSPKGIEVNTWAYVPPVEGLHPHGFYLANVRYTSLELIESDERFVRLESAEHRLSRCNDLAAEMVLARAVHEGIGVTARTGVGVKIAIADSGLDLSHADIPAPVEAFDVTKGTSPADWSRDPRDLHSGHGTHVTGTAVGSGVLSGGRYRGAAPGASLHFYKIEDDSSHFAAFADSIEAIVRAADVGCRIFSMSYGGFDTFLDGSDANSQAADAAFGRGMLCFFAAGNEGAAGAHASFQVPAAGASKPIGFTFDNTKETSANGARERFLLNWAGGGAAESVELSLLGPAGATLTLDSTSTSSRGTRARWYTLQKQVPAGERRTFFLRLVNTSLCPVDVHIWSTNFASLGKARFDEPDPRFTLRTPAVADRAIAVGAWTSRTCWTNWLGRDYCLEDTAKTFPELASAAAGEVAPFSSLGPRIDGALKPNLAAPGLVTISCRDSVARQIERDVNQLTGIEDFLVVDDDGVSDGAGPASYLVGAGTSMATPLAAGCAALVLEANPTLSSAQLRLALMMGASGAGSPDTTGGYGVIDVRRAVEIAEAGVPDGCDPSSFSLADCDLDGIPDACELASGSAQDCNRNGIPDACDLASGTSADCDRNGVPDECDLFPAVSFGELASFQTASRPGSLAAGDFDADGDLDLAVACTTAGRVTILLNDGAAGFAGRVDIDVPQPTFIAAADWNGDQLPELFVARAGSAFNPGNTVSILEGRKGELFAPAVEVTVGLFPSWLLPLEVDGRVEVVAANFMSSSLSLLAETAEGVVVREIPTTPRPQSLAAADLDGDGSAELAVVHGGSTALALFSAGAGGGWAQAGTLELGEAADSVRFADLDGDGRLQLAGKSSACSRLWIWEREKEGALRRAVELETGQAPGALAIADLDGDGRSDLVTANRGAGTLSAFLRRGGGSFAPRADFRVRSAPADVLALDLDGDGRPDLANTNFGSNQLSRLLNQTAPAAADCDLDGILDACQLASGSAADCNRNGIPDACDIASGRSRDADHNGVPDECEATPFVRGDCNGDGAVAGSVSDAVFLLSYSFAGGREPSCLAACDANGDGRATGSVTDAVYLLLFNFSGGPPPPPPYPECAGHPASELGCESAPACAGDAGAGAKG
jgi:subtilisin family serine protease